MNRRIIIAAGFAAGALALEGATSMARAQEAVTELDDIVVTGTRTEQKLSDVPVRTELIKRREIEQTASRTLADAVEFIPGVRAENNCQNCNFTQLRLLGLDGPYSQVLIDGQPLISSVASVYAVEQIPARSIDRIEIVKGGGSALYGPGSVAGIINVITRDPTESGAEVAGTYESIDGEPSTAFDGVADIVTDDGKTRMSILGTVESRDAYDRDGDGFSELGERDLTSTGVRLRQFFSDSADLTVDYSYAYEDRRGGDRLDLPVIQAEVAEAVESTRNSGNATWSHAPNVNFDYRLTAAFAHLTRDTYYGSGMDPNAFGESDNPLYSLDSQFNHYLDDHAITWGAQVLWEEVEDRQPAYDRLTEERYDNVGVYLQDDWSIGGAVSLVLGARVDKHSEIDDPIVSPRAAARWTPRPDLNVRASYASGFRPPQIFDEDLHITQVGGEGQVIRNADDLEEESSRSGTLGFEWTPTVARGYGLLELNGFYTVLDDTFVLEDVGFNPATGAAEFLRVNGSGSEVYGVEINLGYQEVDSFEVRAGWVFQRSEFDEPEPLFGSDEYFRTPESYGVVQGTWSAPGGLDLFTALRYTGSMKVPHFAGFIPEDRLETTPSFLVWDASAGKTFPFADTELTLTVGCKNITDDYQDDLDQGPDRDSGYVYGPRFPRTVYVSASVAL